MTNLLKTLVSITCGLGIISSIPLVSTSCGCSNKIQIKALPRDVYEIDETTHTLKAFKDDFLNKPNSEIYKDKFKDYNTIEIPSDITSIADNAFVLSGEEAIETLIPDFIHNLTFNGGSKIEKIGQFSFYNSTSLTSVNLSNCENLTLINNFAFMNCPIKSVDFSNCKNLATIASHAFANCSAIDSLDLSNCTKLATIADNSFMRCSSIAFVDFSNCLNLSLIDGYAFWECSSIKSINFNNCSKLATIKQFAFCDCSLITSVNLSSSKILSSIGHEAFGGCLLIKDIQVNSSTYHTLKLGNGKVVVENDQTWTNDSEVVGCLACGDILFPDNITQIAMYNFQGCSSLTSIKFSKDSKLTTIDSGAFSSCVSLRSIFLPSELFSFNTDCFKNCSNLSYIEWNCTLDLVDHQVLIQMLF